MENFIAESESQEQRTCWETKRVEGSDDTQEVNTMNNTPTEEVQSSGQTTGSNF